MLFMIYYWSTLPKKLTHTSLSGILYQVFLKGSRTGPITSQVISLGQIIIVLDTNQQISFMK